MEMIHPDREAELIGKIRAFLTLLRVRRINLS
jgi:hypothetical protein